MAIFLGTQNVRLLHHFIALYRGNVFLAHLGGTAYAPFSSSPKALTMDSHSLAGNTLSSKP